jgi:hypothetical protein
MLGDFQRARVRGRGSRSGFALVGSFAVMIFLALAALGMLSLSTFVVREAGRGKHAAEARANARLALMIALGELQANLGPDQRVSASTSLFLGDGGGGGASPVYHPHWTGVWSTKHADGGPIWMRDDLNGGMRDRRAEDGYDRKEAVLSYLVSGNEGGRAVRKNSLFGPFDDLVESRESVALVSSGSVGPERTSEMVSVPLVSVEASPGKFGRYGYWVSDLGVKANVATQNPYAGESPAPGNPANGGYFRLLASQEVDESMMGTGEGEEIDEEVKPRLIDAGQVNLAMSNEWAKSLMHDFTVYSQGVLADVREGGLKKDLTVFLQNGEVAPWRDLPGLSDLDRLVGPRNEKHALALGVDWDASRHRETAPRFGLLRDWARQAESFGAGVVSARTPEAEVDPQLFKGARAAVANDKPTALSEKVRTDLQPVLVEGSTFSTFSYHPNPEGWSKKNNIRSHAWPRVVLWNPYNVTIRVPRSVIMMQLNTRNYFQTTDGFWIWEWLSWGGGTRSKPPQPFESITDSDHYNDPYTGMSYYSLPEETIGPGECYVYSAKKAAEYNSQNLLANVLSSEVAPDPSRNYYVSSAEFDDDNSGSGFDFIIKQFWYHPSSYWTGGTDLNNQADDSRMIWKRADGISTMDVFDFDALPQMQFVSCSLQYGAGKEPRVAWNALNRIDVERTSLFDPVLHRVPDVRTREGFRLRWFREHESNELVQKNVGRAVLEIAPLANWNPRAAYSLRSPWENIDGDPGDGKASGPWFFGAYTRDMYDNEAVGWNAQMPVYSDGKFRGNPFGLPQEGRKQNILFDVARKETGVLSLAQFQHVKLSDLVWHPSYPVANSLVDPRLGKDFMDHTAPSLQGTREKTTGGWTSNAAGWSSDAQRSSDRDEWARFARGILLDFPQNGNLVHDLSFDLNFNLWDEYFLGSGSESQRQQLLSMGTPLPNGRMIPRHGNYSKDIDDFHRAARSLYLNGAFNVNSTSVEAWKAVLASTRPVGLGAPGATAFPRVLHAPGGAWSNGDFAGSDEAWSGFRTLDEEEITRLAEEVVWQVKARGPFLSLGDFVNRRLRKDESGKMGALQAAIEAAGLNSSFESDFELLNENDLGSYSHPDHIAHPVRIAQSLKPSSKAWGAPGYLTQADVLQVVGPMLSARSDSFLIRTYGESVDGAGVVRGRAWCEAVVQRTPDPIGPDASGINPEVDTNRGRWGRKFEIRSFRWLSPSEV